MNKNEYKQFYNMTLESGNSLTKNDNYYLKTQYSKKELIEYFKQFVQEDNDFSDSFKEFIKTSNNVNYRMIYASFYETSCDLYRDAYSYDSYSFTNQYVGTYFYKSLQESKYSPLLDIFKSSDGVKMGVKEEDIDIVTNYHTVTDLYKEMIDDERQYWERHGYELKKIRNQQWKTIHVPLLIIGYEYENEKYFSAIHAVTLQKYIAGEYGEEYTLKTQLAKAKNGDIDAQFEVGLAYEKQGKFKDAIYWYEKASSKNISALNNLGNCYFKGRGCEKNYDKAFECFKTSSEKGNEIAIFNMGICYKNGYGCEKDLEKAIEYFVKADKLGYDNAKKQLDGLCNNNNTKEEATLIKAYKKIEEKFSSAFLEIKNIDERMIPKTLSYDETTERLEKIPFVLNSGSYNIFNNIELREDLNILSKASQEGNGKSSYYLGFYAECDYMKGCTESLDYFKKAVEQGYPLGLLHIARHTHSIWKEYYKEKLSLYLEFVKFKDSKWVNEFKEYFGVASFEIYFLMKKFKDKDKVLKYSSLYDAAAMGVYEAKNEFEKCKDKIGLFYYAEYLKKLDYTSNMIKVYTKSAKKGFIEAQYKLAQYYQHRDSKKSKKWYKKVLKNKDKTQKKYNDYREDAKGAIEIL